jgi:UDP-glucose 4-epimerase
LPVFWANSSAAIKKLNWEPELNIDQMCRDTWNWQKNNPNGYTKTI